MNSYQNKSTSCTDKTPPKKGKLQTLSPGTPTDGPRNNHPGAPPHPDAQTKHRPGTRPKPLKKEANHFPPPTNGETIPPTPQKITQDKTTPKWMAKPCRDRTKHSGGSFLAPPCKNPTPDFRAAFTKEKGRIFQKQNKGTPTDLSSRFPLVNQKQVTREPFQILLLRRPAPQLRRNENLKSNPRRFRKIMR